MKKRDFETYQKRFRDFEILPKFSETHVFRGTIRHPFYRWFTFFAISLSSSMSAISLPDAPPILVPITMLPTIVAAGPGSRKKESRGVNSELTQQVGKGKKTTKFVWQAWQ